MRKRKKGKRRLKLTDVPKYEALVYKLKRMRKMRIRDRALIAVLVYLGCRLNEALSLRVRDLDFRNRTVRIRQLKKKGEFIRIVPVPSEYFWRVMREYVSLLPSRDSRLFEITDRQARNIVYGFTERALGRRYRPHSIRHAYAIFIMKKTRDLEVVRRLLGHSDYDWLKQYLDYTQEDIMEDLKKAYYDLEET